MAGRFDLPFDERDDSSCEETHAPKLATETAALADPALLDAWRIVGAFACAMVALTVGSCHSSGLRRQADAAVAGDGKMTDGAEDSAGDPGDAPAGQDSSINPGPDAALDSRPSDGCAPVACSRSGTDYCGVICDGCGGLVDCPTDCGAGRVCNMDLHMCTSTTCVPLSACQFGTGIRVCGLVGDGCAGVLNCGSCPAGQTCEQNRCVGPGACTPLTCTPASPYQDEQYCGVIDDCCGRGLDCGGCRAGWGCRDHVCRSMGDCPPSTQCQSPGGAAYCGTIGDGCGGGWDCPAICPQPGWTCVQGLCVGSPDVCTKLTCEAPVRPRFCGDIDDGCGGTLKCGTQCPSRSFCVDGLCVPDGDCAHLASCKTDAQTYCGRIGDACIGTLDCSTDCPGDGWTCQDNICVGGPSCPGITCDPPDGRYCGLIGDGCGGTLSCGVCPAGSTCAFGLCLPTNCDGGCPPGNVPLPPSPPVPAPPLLPFPKAAPIPPPLPPLRYQCPAVPATPTTAVPPPNCPAVL